MELPEKVGELLDVIVELFISKNEDQLENILLSHDKKDLKEQVKALIARGLIKIYFINGKDIKDGIGFTIYDLEKDEYRRI